MDYNAYHVETASSYLELENKKVLVVGCNRGKEVAYFVDLDVEEVWGIDLIDEIGESFQHEKAQYFKMSAEAMEFPDESFDFVFCFATMEHVINIDKAFPEMVRVTKQQGIIYCVAAPLWNSRQGHHRSNVFDVDKYPWIHLRFTKEEIIAKCKSGEITYPDGVDDVDAIIEFMMDPRFFNCTPAKEYIDVCNQLDAVEIIRNDLDLEKEHYLALLTVEDFKLLLNNGFNASELLAMTHTFIARKKPLEDMSTSSLGDSPNSFSKRILEDNKRILEDNKKVLEDNRKVLENNKKYLEIIEKD